MSPALRFSLLVLLLAVLGGFGLFVRGGDATDTAVPADAAPTRFHSSTQCAECHKDVWDEWHGSHHQISYLNPEVRKLSDDFRNKMCQACHLPRPVAVTGYAKRTLHRTTLPHEGVSCLTCHLGVNGEVLGRNGAPKAPCRPVASPEMASVSMCESCHNQHETTDQWRSTPLAAAGTDCNSCHMPEVVRPSGRRGRSHVFAGSHDVDMLRRAIRFEAKAERDQLVVEVENVAAGHNFPTEERSRASDVVVQFEGETEWQRVHRFRLPYRSEPLPDTTLPFGTTEVIEVPVPGGVQRATVRMWYRLTPFVGDDDHRSVLMYEQAVELGPNPVAGEVQRPPLPEVTAFRRPVNPPPIPIPAALRAAADAGAAGLNVPPMALSSKLATFRELAGGGPQPPDESRMAELRDLLQTAFVPEQASPRLAALARRALIESDGARWALEEGLTSENPQVRSLAAYELGQLGDAAAVAPLVFRLYYEVDHPETMIWVVDALARLGNHAGLLNLIPLMGRADTAELAGLRAVEICRRAGEDLGDAPTWKDLEDRLRRLHRRWYLNGAVAAPDAITQARIARHIEEFEAFQLRGVDEARFVLRNLGTAAVPLLREALRASEPYLRSHALEVLRELGPVGRPAFADVLPLLNDELTRSDAAVVLGRMGAVEAMPHLVQRLESSDLELRAAAAGALGQLGATSALTKLEAMFMSEDQPLDVRVHSAFSLALLQPDGPARGWLEDVEQREGYHAPTLQELLERIDYLASLREEGAQKR